MLQSVILSGKTIKKIETFSDRFGVFKVDNFRIPLDATIGTWNVNAKVVEISKTLNLQLLEKNKELEIFTDKSNYIQMN